MLLETQKRKLLGAIDVLASAADAIDEFYAGQARLSIGMLRNAADSICRQPTASAVSDFDFALGDLRQLGSELSQSESDDFATVLSLLEDSIASVRAQTQLSATVRATISALRRKLAERSAAIDRQQYRTPGTEAVPLPHPPEGLRSDAADLQGELRAAGFQTPELDRLAEGGGTFYLHDVRQLIEELDVIAT